MRSLPCGLTLTTGVEGIAKVNTLIPKRTKCSESKSDSSQYLIIDLLSRHFSCSLIPIHLEILVYRGHSNRSMELEVEPATWPLGHLIPLKRHVEMDVFWLGY